MSPFLCFDPAFSTCVQGDLATSARLLMDLEDVFKGRVHIVTAGHQHAYGGLLQRVGADSDLLGCQYHHVDAVP